MSGRLALVTVLVCAAFLAAAGYYWQSQSGPSDDGTAIASAPAGDQNSVADSPDIMDSAQREYLWQIEHHGLLLGKHGFQAIASALAANDEGALISLMAEGFRGARSANPRVVAAKTDYLDIVREEHEDSPLLMSAREFTRVLLSLREGFTATPKVKLSLMGLAPVEYGKLDGAWKGGCLVRVWGKAAHHGPRECQAHLTFEISRPSEEHLGRGKWLATCAVTRIQRATAPHQLMQEVATERGIDGGQFHDNWLLPDAEPLVNSGGVYACDVDRDGFVDILITDVRRIALYRGLEGGKFRNVTGEMGLPEIRTTHHPVGIMAGFIDMDGDGWEDLILGDRIYRNVEGNRFVDYSRRTSLRIPEDATGIAIADYDRDGHVDLYVTRMGTGNASSWLTGKSGNLTNNQLWHNLGDWRFEEVTEAAGAGAPDRSTFTAVWLDANNDAWPDLFVINEFGNGLLLLNEAGKRFHGHELTQGPSDFGSMGATAGDVDNDGKTDLYVANMYSKAGSRVIGNLRAGTYSSEVMAKLRSFVAGSQLYRNLGMQDTPVAGGSPAVPRFDPLANRYQVAGVGWSWGPALVDLDNDGWLDLFATCGFISRSRSEPDG